MAKISVSKRNWEYSLIRIANFSCLKPSFECLCHIMKLNLFLFVNLEIYTALLVLSSEIWCLKFHLCSNYEYWQ